MLKMVPKIMDGKYYFACVDQSQLMALANYLDYIVAIFKEDEGLTVVFLEDVKDDFSQLTDQKLLGPFALITLGVADDSTVLVKLAKKKILTKFFSAYNSTYLLVPYDQKEFILTNTKINQLK